MHIIRNSGRVTQVHVICEFKDYSPIILFCKIETAKRYVVCHAMFVIVLHKICHNKTR